MLKSYIRKAQGFTEGPTRRADEDTDPMFADKKTQS